MSRELFEYLNEMNVELAKKDEDCSMAIQSIDAITKTFGEIQNTIHQLNQQVNHIQCKMIINDFNHIKDMYHYINTNPYLKTPEARDNTFDRYVNIYKKNHAEELNNQMVCDFEDKDMTLIQAVNEFLDNH